MKQKNFFLIGTLITSGFLAVLFFRPVPSSIQSINSFSEISWEKVGKKTLVIFDIDDVLVMASDRIYQPSPCNESLKKKILDSLGSKYGITKYSTPQRMSIYLQQGKKKLVEPAILEIIRSLQGRAVKIIGLSNSPGGPFGYIEKMEDWRINNLKSLGVDFSSAFPENPFLRFVRPDFLGKNGEYALFKDGVILTNGFKKSCVLSAFLEDISWEPEEIVFVDDFLEYLQDLQEFARKKRIGFAGYHYHGASIQSEKADEEVAKRQIVHMIEQGCWLSDEEAQEKNLTNSR